MSGNCWGSDSLRSRFQASHDDICETFNVASCPKKLEEWRAKPRFYVLRADYQLLMGTSFSGK